MKKEATIYDIETDQLFALEVDGDRVVGFKPVAHTGNKQQSNL